MYLVGGLLSSDGILQTFVNLSMVQNVGKLHQLNKTLVDARKFNTSDMLVAKSLSNSIIPTNDIEINQKFIVDVLINNYLSGITDFSTMQLNDLRTLAHKCPFTDGIGVYQARVLLSTIDSIGTNYENPCEIGVANRSYFSSITGSIEAENTALIVYPNPASDQLTINYQLDASDIGIFEIYNLIGEKVISQLLSSSENEQKMSLTNLNSGVYFYKYSINDRIVKADKLVIVK